jgi:nitrogen PTS system EIIA component
MKLHQFISPERTVLCARHRNKRDVFYRMLEDFARKYGEDARKQALEKLICREDVGSTGTGDGVAIPHAIVSVDGFERTLLYVALICEGMDFEAVDNDPVHVVFLIISPEKEVRQHIGILARIARLFTNRELVETLCLARTPEDVCRMIAAEDEKYL